MVVLGCVYICFGLFWGLIVDSVGSVLVLFVLRLFVLGINCFVCFAVLIV